MSAHAKYQKNKNQIWTDSVNKSDFTKLYHKVYNWVQFTDVFGLSSIFFYHHSIYPINTVPTSSKPLISPSFTEEEREKERKQEKDIRGIELLDVKCFE